MRARFTRGLGEDRWMETRVALLLHGADGLPGVLSLRLRAHPGLPGGRAQVRVARGDEVLAEVEIGPVPMRFDLPVAGDTAALALAAARAHRVDLPCGGDRLLWGRRCAELGRVLFEPGGRMRFDVLAWRALSEPGSSCRWPSLSDWQRVRSIVGGRDLLGTRAHRTGRRARRLGPRRPLRRRLAPSARPILVVEPHRAHGSGPPPKAARARGGARVGARHAAITADDRPGPGRHGRHRPAPADLPADRAALRDVARRSATRVAGRATRAEPPRVADLRALDQLAGLRAVAARPGRRGLRHPRVVDAAGDGSRGVAHGDPPLPLRPPPDRPRRRGPACGGLRRVLELARARESLPVSHGLRASAAARGAVARPGGRRGPKPRRLALCLALAGACAGLAVQTYHTGRLAPVLTALVAASPLETTAPGTSGSGFGPRPRWSPWPPWACGSSPTPRDFNSRESKLFVARRLRRTVSRR